MFFLRLILAFISLVVPAGDVYRGERFTITIQSESPIQMTIDPRFERLDGGPSLLAWGGGGMLRLSLRVRDDAAPGVAWFRINNVERALRICCPQAPPAMRSIYLPILMR